MSRSVARKRARKRSQCGIDYDASQEGAAIANSLKTHTIDFGKTLHRYYYVDGYKFQTGQKHRRMAVGMSVVDRIPKHQHKQKSKHYNLQSQAVRKRVQNPELYKTLDARRVQRLIEYKVGLARNRIS
jgi:hypothetical protein